MIFPDVPQAKETLSRVIGSICMLMRIAGTLAEKGAPGDSLKNGLSWKNIMVLPYVLHSFTMFFSYHIAWVPVNCTTNPNDWPLGTVGFCNHGIKRGCKPSNDGDWTKNSQLEPQVVSTKSGWWGYWWRLKTCFGLFWYWYRCRKLQHEQVGFID